MKNRTGTRNKRTYALPAAPAWRLPVAHLANIGTGFGIGELLNP